MGFGTLFVGVFLLLNLSFFGFTDLLCGIVLLTAFYKLSGVNRYFKAAIVTTVVFCSIGLAEFIQEIAYLFGAGFAEITVYLHPLRILVICAIALMLLYGIRDVAKEVDVPKTAKRAGACAVASYPVFIFCTTEKIISLFIEEAPIALIIARIITTLSLLVLLVIILITIYSAYMYICTPDEQNEEYVEKLSKFGFVNSFRKRQEEKNREYAEYKLNQMRKRIERKNNKNKKKKK